MVWVQKELEKSFMSNSLVISIVSDKDSWINNYIDNFINHIIPKNHQTEWVNNINNVKNGDICFLIGCSQLMTRDIMAMNKINLVIHESAVPSGKGWSPMTWQILEGKNTIPISLLEVVDKVDSGKIYLQKEMNFEGHELVDELRNAQAKLTFLLCEEFINKYPKILLEGKEQIGVSSFYKRRGPNDSELSIDSTISQNFNLLRTVDNKRYPAFFYIEGQKYKIKIEKFNK